MNIYIVTLAVILIESYVDLVSRAMKFIISIVTVISSLHEFILEFCK